jgi:hypothetical protein
MTVLTAVSDADAAADAPAEDPNKARLRELKAQRAELVARREAAAEEAAAAEDMRREERALRDEQALDAAIAKHGALDKRVATVETDLGLIIVTRPTALKYRRFQDKGSFETDDVIAFVRPCVVHPPLAEFDELLDELPATLIRLANAVVKLAGQRKGELEKK